MNKDLLLAILAMDSYNRGYGQHIDDMDELATATGPIMLGNLRIATNQKSMKTAPNSKLASMPSITMHPTHEVL
jgi:hypothetical protein